MDVILVLLLAGSLYTLGWRRLRRSRRGRCLAAGWRLAACLGGLTLVGLALLSPLDVLASQFFFIHMIQHLLLVMLVPPLLLIANPLPFFMWGAPAIVRGRIGQLFSRKSAFRRGLRAVTPPGWSG